MLSQGKKTTSTSTTADAAELQRRSRELSILKAIAEALNREEIAGHVGISADYLTDCFRQELGITPVTYLNRYRLRQARELLENTDLKITQIALAVGFSESAHFTRTFQREMGVSPRAYRRGKSTAST
jgi:AraC-like DNA-binding protein